MGERCQGRVRGRRPKRPWRDGEVVLLEIDVAFTGQGRGENEGGACREDRRQEEEETLVVALELEASVSRDIEPVDDEAEEEPARRAQVQRRPQNAVARFDQAAPGREKLGERKGDQDRDDDRVEFEYRDRSSSDVACGRAFSCAAERPRRPAEVAGFQGLTLPEVDRKVARQFQPRLGGGRSNPAVGAS